MKKSLVALLALAVCGTALADSVTLKFRNPTKAEAKQIAKDSNESSAVFATTRGLWYVYKWEHQEVVNVFSRTANKKGCVKVTGDFSSKQKEIGPEDEAKAVIVNCPKNVK
jgi:hypothetical protein